MGRALAGRCDCVALALVLPWACCRKRQGIPTAAPHSSSNFQSGAPGRPPARSSRATGPLSPHDRLAPPFVAPHPGGRDGPKAAGGPHLLRRLLHPRPRAPPPAPPHVRPRVQPPDRAARGAGGPGGGGARVGPRLAAQRGSGQLPLPIQWAGFHDMRSAPFPSQGAAPVQIDHPTTPITPRPTARPPPAAAAPRR